VVLPAPPPHLDRCRQYHNGFYFVHLTGKGYDVWIPKATASDAVPAGAICVEAFERDFQHLHDVALDVATYGVQLPTPEVDRMCVRLALSEERRVRFWQDCVVEFVRGDKPVARVVRDQLAQCAQANHHAADTVEGRLSVGADNPDCALLEQEVDAILRKCLFASVLHSVRS
jgi:hypothetical protein